MPRAALLRDDGLSALVDGPLETVASGFEFTEGPLWLPDGSLIWQDIAAECSYRLPPGGGPAELLRDRNGAANGQTFGPDGKIYFAEQNGRRVSRMDPDGSGVEAVVEAFEGRRLNSPNDVVARPDGTLYFTDPPYGVPSPDQKELPYQAVFAMTTAGDLRLVVHEGFEKPNGLAFAPDGATLYVCDTAKYHVRAFELDESGAVLPGSDRVFATMDPGEQGGPDGLKVDREGRLYVAVAQGIWVYRPDGALLGIIATPKRPSNLNWWGREGDALAITAVDAVHRVALKVRGLVPPFLPA
ncbi:SMP-30/gluconolactonase/LRE family protein [Tautonia plasticadhaerens]|uniref:Gluconolactonase n=1 Tax=Tautonia plasticadhaerens TaxID=2527974 RepID=A0A518HAM6_9BACT|nr:SMP-30/gluconolactonase/LRE family protein [Tautonia plasticadhaerens]QDV37904.1 Gluconolactonase precursor [Tautonia plasticadhaerens]